MLEWEGILYTKCVHSVSNFINMTSLIPDGPHEGGGEPNYMSATNWLTQHFYYMHIHHTSYIHAHAYIHTHIQKVGSFDERATRFYSAEIIIALEYLHGKGIIHRYVTKGYSV